MNENCKKINTLNCLKNDSNVYDNSESHSQSEDERNNENFDKLALENFAPFIGRLNVIQWLNEIEIKFNRFQIVRNLRYATISLLVKGEIRYKYMRHRREVYSFNEFYKFLLLQYDVEFNSSNSSKFYQAIDIK